MAAYRVLVVDDEEATRTGLTELISGWGYQSRPASDAQNALAICRDFEPHVILSDLMMPGPSGIELMGAVREDLPQAAFILLTGHGTIENATQAMREGAYDYLTKPVDLARLKVVLEKAVERVSDREELLRLTRDLAERGKFGQLVGRTQIMKDVYRLIGQAAPSRVSVLITGESGTGKEVVARTLHEMSPRRHKPFIAVNCAAIPETLLESEILGHQKGSFTGATADRAGCFELASGGTLLLDEIGEMPPELQAKLLRVLEERTIRRVGGRQEIPVDVRVISSTNTDIARALQNGRFREDLFYRLNVFTIGLPALRERAQDVPLLAHLFLDEFSAANGKNLTGFTLAALDALHAHRWPGNVRELRNVVERAVVVAAGPVIDVGDLPSMGSPMTGRVADATRVEEPAPAAVPSNGARATSITVSVGSTVEEAEELLIMETLRTTRDNKTRAAEILGISTRTLHNKLRRYRGRPA